MLELFYPATRYIGTNLLIIEFILGLNNLYLKILELLIILTFFLVKDT